MSLDHPYNTHFTNLQAGKISLQLVRIWPGSRISLVAILRAGLPFFNGSPFSIACQADLRKGLREAIFRSDFLVRTASIFRRNRAARSHGATREATLRDGTATPLAAELIHRTFRPISIPVDYKTSAKDLAGALVISGRNSHQAR
jgi:hypothetical protein